MDKYNIGIYLRISLKDRDSANESNSIRTQGEIINHYIQSMDCFKGSNIFTYCDDGFSGTSFSRPDVERLLEDVKTGKLNCVIVKDISRFGRNYIQVGNYLEKIFPFLGVRFIAISDEYDSDNADDMGDLTSAFKSIFADIYSKELSAKVKFASDRYAEQGKYISSFTPYGYEKSKSDKNKLVIDETAAEIVRQIFYDYLQGKGKTEIARELNVRNVPTPMMHKKSKGINSGISPQEVNLWTFKAIDTILKNQSYIGNYVFNVNCRIKVGSTKFKTKPKEEWIICENAHDQIISKDIFEKANAQRKKVAPNKKSKKDVLATLTTCGVCNHRLRLNKRVAQPYFDCKTKVYTDKFACRDTKIEVSTIKDALITSIQAYIKSAADRKKLMESTPLATKLKSLKAEYAELKKAHTRWTNRLRELLQDSFDGKISHEIFCEQKRVVDSKRTEIDDALVTLHDEITSMQKQANFDKSFVDSFSEIETLTELTDDVLKLLVKEVIVHDSNTIEIKWTFESENM